MAISLRLDEKTEKTLERFAKLEKRSKSEIVRELISNFLRDKQTEVSPWELGNELFGKEASGDGMLSSNRKKIMKDMVNAKKNRH